MRRKLLLLLVLVGFFYNSGSLNLIIHFAMCTQLQWSWRKSSIVHSKVGSQ